MAMTFTRLQDVFDHIRQIHCQASECCTRATNASDQRLKLLVDFFGRWEKRLGEYLGVVENEAGVTLLDTWVQFAGTDDVDNALAEVRRTQSESSDTLIEKSWELQEAILVLFEQLADNSETPEVRANLLNLAELERKAIRDLSAAMVTQRDA